MLPEAPIAQYRALSGLAVAALVLGLLSPVAIVDPLLWTVPFLGVVVGGLALLRIALRAPALTGRTAALIGLLLSVLFSAAGPAERVAYRWALRREARQFALQWFDFLAENRPQNAHQLILDPRYRQPLDEHLDAYYVQNPTLRADLETYVAQPPVSTLLALGRKAEVRYCATVEQRWDSGGNVAQLFSVTGDDAGEPKTFFVLLSMDRIALDSGRANWQIRRAEEKRISDL
jgi:hypothetical protein